MQTAHIIDEVIFDLSFVSTSVPDDHESKVSAWITDQILPVVDAVLNELDQAKTVFRLDLVEIDLGDVTEEAFQTVLVQRLKEKLSGMLQGIRGNSGVLNPNTALPSRVSYAQVDLKQLQHFLMTGRMAWHVSTSGRQAHEQILERVLQEQSDVFIQFLKQSTAKSTLIDRLVKQFTEPYLVKLLQKVMPTHATLTLNLLEVYRATITEKRFSSASNVASIDALWVSIFDVVLDQSFASKDQATVASAVVEKLMASSASDSVDLMKKMQRVATRLRLEKKVDATLPKLLTDVHERRRDAVKAKDGRKTGARLQKKAQKKEHTAQYQRIINALKAAKVAAFHPLLKGLRQHPIKIRERLATQGKQAAMREQLAEKLTDDILLDITDLFVPVAVSYLKQLLAQSSVLHQGVGETVWKQQLWESHLSYLFAEPNEVFVPTDYLKSLASGMSPTQDAPSVLRIWHAELSTTSAQATAPILLKLLQQVVVDEDHALLQVIDHAPSDSEAYKTLMQRLQQGTPQDDQPLQPVIDKLALEHPEQCQRIYDAIRGGTLSTANLNTREQRQLLIAFIDQAPAFDVENRAIFIQAITSHADGAAAPLIYYQQILQALLHDQPVDLEAMQKQKTMPLGEHGTTIQHIEAEAEVQVKEAATIDRTVQYQRIVQALEETEIAGFYPLPEGLQQHPVMIRQLLAEHGKQATTRQQLAVKLTDKILIDIADLYIPAAVSFIKQLLAQADILHQGVGEIVWKQQLWESNLSYLFTEANVTFIPADYLKALARLMSPTNDAQPVLIAWYQILFATMGDQLAEHTLVNLLRQLITDEDGLLPLEIDQSPSSEAYKTLMQRLQQGASQDTQPLQPVMAELAQDHPQQLQRIYELIRDGKLSTARLNVADQRQLLTAFIDQAPAFNTENRAAFIQAIESHADHAVDQSTYYQRVLHALLHDQPVDLIFLSKQSDSSGSLVMRGGESTVTDAELSDQAYSDVYQTLFQRLQQGVPQTPQLRQGEIAELAQDHPQQLQRIFGAIRGGKLSMARLNAVDQCQFLMAFIDQAPAFNAENRATFIQAIESHADHAVEQSIYYQLILQALLHDQPVDLVFLSKQSDSSESLAVRGAETADQRPVFDEYEVPVSEQDIDAKEMIEISNAGQIIAAPYLPRLFQMLKLLDDEGTFVSLEAAERAVHLLQFMVDEQSESPEYLLILNKILCGIPTAVPIRRQLDLSDNEKTVVEDLIKGMIQNWKAIGSTSVSGFRETFLQRDGGLLLEDDAWHLTVHPGTFDMLLDGLPWSFSIVKHSWMDKAIHVDWR